MRKNRLSSICLVLCTVLAVSATFGGCGESVSTDSEEIIELLEPVGSVTLTEPVVRRNLYNARIYEANVYPYFEEYAYETSQSFGSYGVMAGESVQAGQVLMYADNESLLRQIEDMEERIQTLTESYEEYCQETEESLAIHREEQENYHEILENLEAEMPPQFLTVSGGDAGTGENRKENPEYSRWQREYRNWDGRYSYAAYQVALGEEALRQRTELYRLDYNYYQSQLQALQSQRKKGKLTAGISGEVVAMRTYNPGTAIGAMTPVMAVGDMDRKLLVCDYILNRTVYNAREIYAFINGRKYDLIYQEEAGDDSKSVFSIVDEEDQVSVGDYGVMVLITDFREQVLTVPTGAIHSEGLEWFVYVMDKDTMVNVPVKRGMSDGVYTEILSGLEEGMEVVVSQKTKVGTKTQVLEKATVVGQTRRGEGILFFSDGTLVKNTIENGTVCFVDYQVSNYQKVEAGDVIATVRVEGDSFGLMQMETNLKRARERLADLIAGSEGEENEGLIAQRREAIEEQEEELARLRSDYSATAIYAPVSGLVTGLVTHEENDVLRVEETIGMIVNDSEGYVLLRDEGDYLNYNNPVEVSYTDSTGEQAVLEGVVANISFKVLSNGFQSGVALVRMPGEVLQNLNITRHSNGTYSISSLHYVAEVQVMDNVLLVPVGAVTVDNSNYYVNVWMDDGTVVRTSFLAGGKVDGNYWVIDGLTEGMKLCWE